MASFYGNYCNCHFGWRLEVKKNKVLIVGGFPSKDSEIFGGIVTSCLSLVESSFSEKFEIITVDSTQKSNPIPPFSIRLLLSVKRTLLYVFKLVKYRPNVVILFPAIGASLVEKGLMSWVAFFLRIPAFMFPRGGPLLDEVEKSKFTRSWVRLAFGGATKVLCQGPAWKTFAKEVLNVPEENSPIIYNWTATDSLISIGKKKLETQISYPLRILYLGWIEEEKGIFDFLDALSKLENINKIKVSIAGGGSCVDKSKKIARRNGLDDVVHFNGWVYGLELEELFSKSDILVLPSWAEGFPNAVIEAMAAGLAVIVTSVGNIPDILTHNSEALLVPPKDVVSLRNTISRLVDDEILIRSLGSKGHEFAKENFAIEEAVSKLEKLIYAVAH